jgi:hypothetical protein
MRVQQVLPDQALATTRVSAGGKIWDPYRDPGLPIVVAGVKFTKGIAVTATSDPSAA